MRGGVSGGGGAMAPVVDAAAALASLARPTRFTNQKS